MKNPLFDEQVRAGIINFYMVKIHLIGLGIITLLVFLFYPSQNLSYFLTRSVRPEMFNVALYSITPFISYLTIKTAVFSIQNTKVITIDEWFLYTKLKVMTYLWGRISYGLFYTTFLILLFSPVLLVAASVTAIGPYNILSIILMIYLFILNLYLLGLVFFTFFKRQHWILTLVLWGSVILLLFLSPSFFPDSHPALLLLNLQSSTNILKEIFYPFIISLGSICLLILISWLSLYLYNRRLHGV